MLAAVDASVEALTLPVVMKEQKPGRGTAEPFGMTCVNSSSSTPRMPMPSRGSATFKLFAPVSARVQCVGMLELQVLVQPRTDLRQQ